MKVWNGYQKGINLGGWFSQCDYSKDRFDNFIVEEDFKVISSWGLDHVRIPVDYNLVEDDNGNYKESGFAYLDKAISWCKKYNLNMILDLHKTAGYSFDAKEMETGFFNNEVYQNRFYNLWTEFTKRYGKYSDFVAFELLNEVTDPSYMDSWKMISEECVKRIREINKDVYILLGSYWNNHATAVKALPMPFDEKIVYNFHCYDPLIITHQGAYWIPDMPLDFRYHYDNTYKDVTEAYNKYLPNIWGGFKPDVKDMNAKFGPDFFENLFAEAIKVAEERNVALYCGEYGVIENADPKDILAWYKDINSVFVKHNIGRAAWSYRKMDFDLCGDYLKDVIKDLVKVF